MLLVPARLIDVNGFQCARPTWPIGGTNDMSHPVKAGIGGAKTLTKPRQAGVEYTSDLICD